ncbi:MAG: ABC transporter ATP-binding protein/permease [Oscillospiraceae bacterium]|jgi:ATP-binding cassette subfamily B protein|nr:ABC transporter ATP-binding protein/permease [Oscillospiraceae bacterium]
MKEIKWLWSLLKGYRAKYVLSFAISLTTPVFAVINPYLTGRMVDDVFTNHITTTLVYYIVLMLILRFTRTCMDYGAVALVESSSLGMLYELRMKLYRHLQKQDMNFFGSISGGDLMTILTSDVDMVRHNLVFVFRQIFSSALLYVIAAGFYFWINWKFALCMIAVTPFIFFASIVYRNKIKGIYKELRQRLSKLNSDARENIEGNRVVKAFANEPLESEKFDDKSQSFRDQNLYAQKVWLKYYPIIDGLTQTNAVVTIIIGGLFLMSGEITPGDLISFTSLSWAVTAPFQMLGQLFNDLQRFFASAGKIMSILDEEPKVQNTGSYSPAKEGFRGKVEFRNVSFSFESNKVLDNISFTIPAGKTCALMGETGSGKTLIADLLSRFYDVDEGQVLVDGVDVRDWDLNALRSHMGITTQEVFLFSDTVDSNIAYGDYDMSADEVQYFANAAAARFINEMPDGYATIVGERGVGLSGGQKQRIALARALAVKPGILILDDTTSAVDMETEKYIQQQLKQLDFNCSKLIIAQRISSVRDADQILMLENGSISECGSHSELLERQGVYYSLWKIQAGEELVA